MANCRYNELLNAYLVHTVLFMFLTVSSVQAQDCCMFVKQYKTSKEMLVRNFLIKQTIGEQRYAEMSVTCQAESLLFSPLCTQFPFP